MVNFEAINESLLPTSGREGGRCLKFPSELANPDTIDWSFGWAASPKLDGNRCLIKCGEAFTSSMRPFRNVRVQELLKPVLERSRETNTMVDCEIYDVSGEHHAKLSGALNSYDDELPPCTTVYIFDSAPMELFADKCTGMDFDRRIWHTKKVFGDLVAANNLDHIPVVIADQIPVVKWSQASEFFDRCILAGWEGTILRSCSIRFEGGKCRGGWYKFGRATVNEQIGFKMKLYNTADGVITEVMQARTLDLKKITDRKYNPDGTLAHVNHKDAYILDDKVGAFKVRWFDHKTLTTVESEIGFGLGFDHAERRRLWKMRDKLVGTWAEFLHMPHGAYKSARHGRLVRFRPDKEGVDLK